MIDEIGHARRRWRAGFRDRHPPPEQLGKPILAL
jgi:hypothetical protein